MRNITFIIFLLSSLFAQNEIEGRWHLVGYEDLVMYEFVDTEPLADAGWRYTLYSIDGDFGDLDDAGIFIFSYLLYDYKKKILSLQRLKESVYTLNLFRKKMISSLEKMELPLLGEFQVIFTLYEKMKYEEMSWEDCEEYLIEQISAYKSNN